MAECSKKLSKIFASTDGIAYTAIAGVKSHSFDKSFNSEKIDYVDSELSCPGNIDQNVSFDLDLSQADAGQLIVLNSVDGGGTSIFLKWWYKTGATNFQWVATATPNSSNMSADGTANAAASFDYILTNVVRSAQPA